MVLHIILADILLIARIFPRPFGARKNTTQLAKYPRVLYVKPSNKIYILAALGENIFRIGLRRLATPSIQCRITVSKSNLVYNMK